MLKNTAIIVTGVLVVVTLFPVLNFLGSYLAIKVAIGLGLL